MRTQKQLNDAVNELDKAIDSLQLEVMELRRWRLECERAWERLTPINLHKLPDEEIKEEE